MKNEQAYIDILKSEMVVAMGCTEPLAVAYAGSLARHILGNKPTEVILKCSSNIIKNVRCVSVPNSAEFNGIKAAVLLGVFGGDYQKGFSCISSLSNENKEEAKNFINNGIINVDYSALPIKLHIALTIKDDKDEAFVEIKESHLNVCLVKRNNEILYSKEVQEHDDNKANYEELLSFDNIYDFACNIDLNRVLDIIVPQYNYNYDIAVKGLEGKYGVNIGKTIISTNNSLDGKIIAYTASASEARMCGCTKPVIINSGSGNQGLSTSVPIIVYGKEMDIPIDMIYRALVLANLLTIKQKYRIGALSAFCGVVSSCCSAGAGITFLAGGTKEQIKMTISNHLATVPGIICDGAKASCASKIAVSLYSALLSHHLAMNGLAYHDGDGILKSSIDDTIDAVADIGREGMKETDEEIMKILLKD